MAELTYWAAPTYLLDDWCSKSPEVWGRLTKACLLYVLTGNREASSEGLYPGDMEAFAYRCREIDGARAAVQAREAKDLDTSEKRRQAAYARWRGESARSMQVHANASKYQHQHPYQSPPYKSPRLHDVHPRGGNGKKKTEERSPDDAFDQVLRNVSVKDGSIYGSAVPPDGSGRFTIDERNRRNMLDQLRRIKEESNGVGVQEVCGDGDQALVRPGEEPAVQPGV